MILSLFHKPLWMAEGYGDKSLSPFLGQPCSWQARPGLLAAGGVALRDWFFQPALLGGQAQGVLRSEAVFIVLQTCSDSTFQQEPEIFVCGGKKQN